MNNDNEQVPLLQALTEFAIGLDRILEGGEAGELIREARDEITRLQSALATARREGIEDAGKWHDERAAMFMREHDRYIERHTVDPFGGHRSEAVICEMKADLHRDYAKSIRALLSQSVEVGPSSTGNGGSRG